MNILLSMPIIQIVHSMESIMTNQCWLLFLILLLSSERVWTGDTWSPIASKKEIISHYRGGDCVTRKRAHIHTQSFIMDRMYYFYYYYFHMVFCVFSCWMQYSWLLRNKWARATHRQMLMLAWMHTFLLRSTDWEIQHHWRVFGGFGGCMPWGWFPNLISYYILCQCD